MQNTVAGSKPLWQFLAELFSIIFWQDTALKINCPLHDQQSNKQRRADKHRGTLRNQRYLRYFPEELVGTKNGAKISSQWTIMLSIWSYISNNWFEFCLKDWDYFVSIGNPKSLRIKMMCGVHQGSILGPLLFLISTCSHSPGLYNNNITCCHNYADNTQIYITL